MTYRCPVLVTSELRLESDPFLRKQGEELEKIGSVEFGTFL